MGSAVVTVLGLSSAQAAPTPVTFNPGAAGLNGGAFTADKFNLLNFTRVDLAAAGGVGTTFTESGILQVNNASLANNTFTPAGLGTGYSLYFKFTGSGIQDAIGASGFAGGTLTTLTASLVGVNGPASFGVTNLVGGNPSGESQPFVNVTSPEVTLATGSLVNGGTFFSSNPLGAGANLTTTFENIFNNFITSPTDSVFGLAGAFNNNMMIVSVVNGGRSIVLNGGGGDVSFSSTGVPVPEPASMLLVGAGLAGVGFVRRRRQAV